VARKGAAATAAIADLNIIVPLSFSQSNTCGWKEFRQTPCSVSQRVIEVSSPECIYYDINLGICQLRTG